MYKAALRILTIIVLIVFQTTVQSAEKDRQKYKDALNREAALFRNPEFYKKFINIKETAKAEFQALEARKKVASINIDKLLAEIKKTYESVFKSAATLLDTPYCKKELITDPMVITLVKEGPNPYYNAILKTIDDCKSALHRHAFEWMPQTYDAQREKIRRKEKSAIFDLIGEYDPELKKAHEELDAIDK